MTVWRPDGALRPYEDGDGSDGLIRYMWRPDHPENRAGIRPDLVVQIRADLLDEIDGPMLRHGLQDRHGQKLMTIPRSHREQPDRELLEQQYMVFRAS